MFRVNVNYIFRKEVLIMWKVDIKKLENMVDSMLWCSTALQPRYNKIILDNSELGFNEMKWTIM